MPGPRRLLLTLPLLALSAFAQRSIPIENEFVRVLIVVDPPVTKPGAMHVHDQNRVMIYLDAADINIRHENGQGDEDQHWKPGDIAWSPATGRHTSEHVSAKPARIVEIELRKPGSGSTPKAPATGVLLDKPQVLVYRATTPPPPGNNYIAVNMQTAETVWNGTPSGKGPFVITLLK